MINAKNYNNWGMALVLTIIICKTAESSNKRKEVDALNYTLTFYDQEAESYDTAKTICADIEATLVVLHDNFVLDVVNNTIKDATNVDYFFVGAERTDSTCAQGPDAINCKWEWADGLPVDMKSISWYENQPDNHNNVENRMVIQKKDAKSGDVSQSYNLAGIICQKEQVEKDTWKFETPRFRLTFHDKKASNWSAAVKTCCDIDADMIQLDDDDVRDAVYEAIGRAKQVSHFWIGAMGKCYDWSWLDGTPVTIELKWYVNQPDNYDNDNKLVIDKSLIKFGDVKDDFGGAGVICQEKRDCVDNSNQCIHGECMAPGLCICNQGHYGMRCQDCGENPKLCVHGECDDNGKLCKCDNGYYGNMCQDCNENPAVCVHGTCEKTSMRKVGDWDTYFRNSIRGSKCGDSPTFFTHSCDCSKTGYTGEQCDELKILLDSQEKAIGIVGAYASIEIEITTIVGPIIIEVHKNKVTENPIQNKTNVGNGFTTFTFFIDSKQDEGTYIFVSPSVPSTATNTSTSLIVHMNATIVSYVQPFIFSPVTNGSSELNCTADGFPTPNTTWYNSNDELVAFKRDFGIYQTIDNSIATLHVDNAVEADDGDYTCKTVNVVGEDFVSVSDEKVSQLAVYGNPTILAVKSEECAENGQLTIEWRPNEKTTSVLHSIEIQALNETSGDNITQVKVSEAGETATFNNLHPSVEYNILIKVCPDLCIERLSVNDTQTTGHGLPGIVTNAHVDQDENSHNCIVKWEWPDTPNDQIIDYNIITEAKLTYVPPETETAEIVNKENTLVEAPGSTHTQITKPNSEYNFYIEARTCAGFGRNVTAMGSCETKYSAPVEVPVPEMDTPAEAGPTRKISISLADETNGPISCSFVIVNRGNKNNETNVIIGLQQLQDAENAALNGCSSSEYLAIAIPRENMTSNVYETNLGDDTESSCDVSNIFTRRRRNRRNTEPYSYRGKNLALATRGTEYGFYVVTATPADGGEVLLKSSEIQMFTNGIAQPPSVVGAAVGGAVGGVLAIVLVVAGIYIWRRRNSQKKKDEVFTPPTTTDEGNVNPQFVEDEPELEYEGVVADVTNSDTDIPLHLLKQIYIKLKANESMLFREEYQKLKAQSRASAPPSTFGGSERNMSKNRYKNILPYDCTRVHLGQEEDQEYINACHVNGYNEKKFIATQGPLSNTVIDFWKMVVEQRCKVIVMLTKCNEAGRMKCEQYWPESNQTIQYGDICVRNQAEKYFGGYVVRTLGVISPYNENLTVVQYQFVQWPDHGVPKTTSSFFRFHKEVMNAYDSTSADAPLLVHCSAGVGRTGTFIGYDVLQNETVHQKKTSVDIFSCVLNMRQERVDMVQTCDQYELLHKLLLERYLFGETDVNENEIKKIKEKTKSSTIRDKFEKEFQNLNRAESLKFKSKEDPYHIQDPRDRVVIVRQPGDTGLISFDGTYVEAYDKTIKLIAVRSPLNSTVEYFLRAILDNDINTIVMLDKPGRKNLPTESVQYWPESSKEPLHVKNITVTLGNQRTNRGISERTLIVSRYSMQPKVVTQFGYSSWTTKVTKQNPREILDLVSTVQAYTLQKKESVILVHCSDGLGKSGSFCALMNILERMKNEGQVDVFRAVKDLRDLKSGMVQTLDQYKFCYEVVQARLSTENIYANAVFESEEPQDPVYENIQKI